MPAARRDLSVAVAAEVDEEALGDRLRRALGDEAAVVEELRVLASTPAEALPAAARARLGIRAGQKNLLLRLVLRRLDGTLTAAEANRLRDRVRAAVREGG